jgi:hypothetical protein
MRAAVVLDSCGGNVTPWFSDTRRLFEMVHLHWDVGGVEQAIETVTRWRETWIE